MNVTYHPSDDPVKAAKQDAKIGKLMDRIIKVGDNDDDLDE